MTKQEFLAMSLPYGLKCKEVGLNEIFTLNPKLYSLIEILNWSNVYQPILRPLSDLSRCIIQKGYNNEEPFFPLYKLQKEDKAFTTDFICAFGVEECKFSVIELLLKWHFDIADLISKGEAIDVNTLNINPYK